MAIWCSIKQSCFWRIDRFQKLSWVSFVLKIDQIFVIFKNLHIRKLSPSSLNFLCCNFFDWFLRNLFLFLSIITVSPLNLDSSNMVHWKNMIFVKSSSQTHFKSRLYFCSTKVEIAIVFLNVKNIEFRLQKLFSQQLSRSEFFLFHYFDLFLSSLAILTFTCLKFIFKLHFIFWSLPNAEQP